MANAITPSPDHTLFDRLCERIDDFDYLTVDFAPAAHEEPAEEDAGHEHEEAQLDELILAGLITPT